MADETEYVPKTERVSTVKQVTNDDEDRVTRLDVESLAKEKRKAILEEAMKKGTSAAGSGAPTASRKRPREEEAGEGSKLALPSKTAPQEDATAASAVSASQLPNTKNMRALEGIADDSGRKKKRENAAATRAAEQEDVDDGVKRGAIGHVDDETAQTSSVIGGRKVTKVSEVNFGTALPMFGRGYTAGVDSAAQDESRVNYQDLVRQRFGDKNDDDDGY